MDVSGAGPDEGRARRSVVVLLALVVLLAVVAIASTGHTPIGSGGTRRPAELIVDTIVSLLLVLVLAGSVLFFYLYYVQRTAQHEERRKGNGNGGNRRALLSMIAVAALLTVLTVRVALDNRNRDREGAVQGGAGQSQDALGDKSGGYEPRFATVPVIVILGAAGLAGLAAFLSARAGRGALRPLDLEPSLALALADVLDETLDDLRAEPDPRKAVIAAYARLERALAAFGLPRRPAEAPDEYLRRVLVDFQVGAGSARRLTQLFGRAKFSQHEIGPDAKDEAIELLESIRADLLAADAARTAMASPPGAAQEQPL